MGIYLNLLYNIAIIKNQKILKEIKILNINKYYYIGKLLRLNIYIY